MEQILYIWKMVLFSVSIVCILTLFRVETGFEDICKQCISMQNAINMIISTRVATVREKYVENEIFSRSGKSQGICGSPGKFRKDLENQEKVREFENKWLWQA